MWYPCQWLKAQAQEETRHEIHKEKWFMRTQETNHKEIHVAQGTFAGNGHGKGYGYRQEIGSVPGGKRRVKPERLESSKSA